MSSEKSEQVDYGLKYFDKESKSLTVEEWRELFEDMDYRRIALDETNGWRLSTVWLGMEHQIFETMLFWDGDTKAHTFVTDFIEGGDQYRFSTESSARRAHMMILEVLHALDRLETL